MVSPLISIGESIGDVGDMVYDGMMEVVSGVEDLVGGFGNVVSYLNPVSDSFILSLAFVPEDGYLEDSVSDLKSVVDSKFTVLTQLEGITHSLENENFSYNDDWPGITADLSTYGIGEVVVVGGEAINYVKSSFKSWFTGFVYLMMAFFTYKRFMYLMDA